MYARGEDLSADFQVWKSSWRAHVSGKKPLLALQITPNSMAIHSPINTQRDLLNYIGPMPCFNSIMCAAIFPLSRMPSQRQTNRPLAFEWWTEGRSEYFLFVAHHEMQLFMLGAMISMRFRANLGGITIWQMAACFGFNPRHHHRRHRQPSAGAFAYIKNKLCSYSVECAARIWWCGEATHARHRQAHRWIRLICRGSIESGAACAV